MTTARTVVLVLAASVILQGCFAAVATGVVGTTLAVADRRSVGAQVDDEGIEVKAEVRVGKQFPSAHVNVISYNRRALITGEVVDEAAVHDVGKIVSRVENVVSSINELQIAPPSTFSSRANDAYITSKVKARFVDAGKFSVTRVKVFTEAGTVFLMGVVTQGEANAAIEIARTTGSVKKVVNVMEVITDAEARRIDAALGASASSGTTK
jgi:osmotically-inducible protein OsmY